MEDKNIEKENEEELKDYFNPKEYHTQVIGIDKEDEGVITEESTKKEVKQDDKIDSIISLLTDPEHKSVKEQTLLNLKNDKKGDVLLLAIASPKSKEVRNKLVAACWESEIDFSKYLPFFILLALDTDYLVSIEAMTVITTMEGPFDEEKVKEGIEKVKTTQKSIKSEKVVLLNDLIDTLESFIAK